MRVVTNNVCIKYVEIGEFLQIDDNFKPIDYEIGIEFFGIDYTWCLNVEELKKYLLTGILFCDDFVGDSILFSSASEFFEKNSNYAQILVDTIEEVWNDTFPNSIYNFVGDTKHERFI